MLFAARTGTGGAIFRTVETIFPCPAGSVAAITSTHAFAAAYFGGGGTKTVPGGGATISISSLPADTVHAGRVRASGLKIEGRGIAAIRGAFTTITRTIHATLRPRTNAIPAAFAQAAVFATSRCRRLRADPIPEIGTEGIRRNHTVLTSHFLAALGEVLLTTTSLTGATIIRTAHTIFEGFTAAISAGAFRAGAPTKGLRQCDTGRIPPLLDPRFTTAWLQ